MVLVPQKWRAFLYRRLASWITCEVKFLGDHPLGLDSKFQVNSLQDVFCHPFYWQLYNWPKKRPNLVLDLGAHCGHFSMLADVCLRTQFGDIEPEYVLVEPNPHLCPVIRRNFITSGLCRRHSVQQGLVGARQGVGTLWVSPKNYLSSSLSPSSSAQGVPSSFLDLDELLGNKTVDLLKIDIEGAEYEFTANYPELLSRVTYLMIEIHAATAAEEERLLSNLKSAGLNPVGEMLQHSGHKMARFQRS